MSQKQNRFKIIFKNFGNFILRLIKILFWPVGLFLFFLVISKLLSQELSKIILDYLKVIIWPLVVICSIIYFRKNIADLIFRIKNIEGAGVKVDCDSEKEQEETRVIETKPFSESISEVVKTQLSSSLEDIKKEYEQKALTYQEESTKKIEYLINELSLTNLALEFERIYRIIFGSQIQILRHLNQQDDHKLPVKSLMVRFYFTQRAYEPNLNSFDFSKYISFIINNGLISLINNYYQITDKGKDFLSYIDYLGYPNKNL